MAGCGLRQLQADEKVSKDEEYTGEHFDIINLAKGFTEQLATVNTRRQWKDLMIA